MIRRSLWPRGLTGRVILILIFAVLAQFLAGSMLIRIDEIRLQRQDQGRRIAEQLLIAERIVKTTPPPDRARLLERLSTAHIRLTLIEGSPPLPPGIDPDAALIARSVIEFEPSLAKYPMRVALDPGPMIQPGRRVEGVIGIEPDVWIGFRTLESGAGWRMLLETSVGIGLVALLVFGSAAVLVRTFSAPLRCLADNARSIGAAGRVVFDEETGPKELQEVSRALNAMQARLEGVVNQRTQALLAVGHDLRTPLARLRLRVDALAETADRRAARADIDQMTRMLQELIDFFATGESRQEREQTDLSSLCQTIGEAFSDQGADVLYEGPDRLVIAGIHDHLARAIENLVDNAVKYAGAARIVLTQEDRRVWVTVEDRGPGIPPAQLARVMRPFERLDASRSDRHPGMGLGLSIADNVSRAHGGRLNLVNRSGGGLRAQLLLAGK